MNSYLASLGPALANHLWQSTAFAVVAWLLTLALRKNQARVRYAIWLAASIKFLVPFSLLVSAGNLLPHPKQPVVSVLYSAMDVVEEPFAAASLPLTTAPVHVRTLWERAEAISPACLGVLWLSGVGTVLFGWWNRWCVLSVSLHQATVARDGRELEILRRLESEGVPEGHGAVLQLLMSAERLEPGIFGVIRPVLMWPEQLSARLDDEHIEVIIAHELTHVRRKDNLTALLHLLVEALCWFHPLVWWIERQMVNEREQACDEAVVEMGGSAETYAKSLVETCRFCIESPLTCVAGITGGELGKRIRLIVAFSPKQLGQASRLALCAAAVGAIAAPVALGLAHRPLVFGQILKATGPLPSFEVASIHVWKRPAPPPEMVGGEQIISQQVMKFSPGREGAQTSDRVHIIAPLGVLIAQAYGLPPGSDGRADGRIVGGPDWMTQDSDQYDIQAKIDEHEYTAMQKMTAKQQREQVNMMKQSLLADRFKLKMHFETRELPAYALVVAKDGPKLTQANDDESTMLSSTHQGQTTEMRATAATLSQFADSPLLSAGTRGRTVVDQTGLNSKYDFTLKWGAESAAGQEPSDQPALFTAIHEQLGLKLIPTKGPVEVIVIDRVEKPTVDGAETPNTITTPLH
jgi:bla regulator protein BlaR1